MELLQGPDQSGHDLHDGKNGSRNHATPAARKSERGQNFPHPHPHVHFSRCCACAFVVLPYSGRTYGGGAMDVESTLTYRGIPSLNCICILQAVRCNAELDVFNLLQYVYLLFSQHITH